MVLPWTRFTEPWHSLYTSIHRGNYHEHRCSNSMRIPIQREVEKMKPVFWKRKTIALGEQVVSELTILEWKPLFSMKLFHFHETQGCQDRFHTHAFNSVSILLHGDYTEEVISFQGARTIIEQLPRSRKRILHIPRNQYHRITKSTDCRTLLLTGPWGENFFELRDIGDGKYQHVTCGEGRKDLRKGSIIRLEDVE